MSKKNSSVDFYTDEEIEDLNKILDADKSEKKRLLDKFIEKNPHRNRNAVRGKLSYMKTVGAKPHNKGVRRMQNESNIIINRNEVRFPYKTISIDTENEQVVVTF